MEVESTGSIPSEILCWLNPNKSWSLLPCKESLLAVLEQERLQLCERMRQLEEEKSRQSNANRDYWAIPSKEALDRIHRYETANVRHRYKVEASLEKLQSRRRENAKENSGKSPQDGQFCETKPIGSVHEMPKGPYSVGVAAQASDDMANPPIQVGATGAELAAVDPELPNDANK